MNFLALYVPEPTRAPPQSVQRRLFGLLRRNIFQNLAYLFSAGVGTYRPDRVHCAVPARLGVQRAELEQADARLLENA